MRDLFAYAVSLAPITQYILGAAVFLRVVLWGAAEVIRALARYRSIV